MALGVAMPEGEPEVDFDRSVIGVEYLVIEALPVTAQLMREFARALGEDPIYWDEEAARRGRYGGLVAVPTFCTLFNFRFVSGPSPDLKFPYGTQTLEGGQSVENYLHIRPGDTLKATTKIREVFAKTGRAGTMLFILHEDSFYNQRGEKVSTVIRTLIRR